MTSILLPIAQVEINIIIILIAGLGVGFLSGLFGVGGGFLMTPLLIFLGIPPATAVGTEANQILGSSVSGGIAHGRKGNIDYEIGLFLLIGGIFGSTVGVVIFRLMRDAGKIDLLISLLYIAFLTIIGSLMLYESVKVLIQKENKLTLRKRRRNFIHSLPMKFKFRKSMIYVSILIPISIGLFVGFLSSLMGVGGGFIMVPAMIYLLGMKTIAAIGTSLFQIVFVTANIVILQATYNQSVDLILAILLLIGGVVGAQLGSKYSMKIKGEYLRVCLAMLVLLVSLKMSMDLLNEPSSDSRIIIQETNS
ncbi:MAG: permease [Rickettsiales bacterium]|nr:permease [Rickettsiales bacterium]